MRILLPNQFKKVGAVIAPLGFATWLATQLLYLDAFLGPWPASIGARRVILVSSAFSFLFGMYFLAFSKEKLEDEMIQRLRLDSFLFAAYLQMALMFAFFLWNLFVGDLKGGGFELFMIGTILLFWVSHILRFNYSLRISYGAWTTE